MNRKNMPIILMLAAGAVVCVVTIIKQYTVFEELLILLAVLVIFYGLGSILKWTLDYFDRQNEKQAQMEGEVIEKEAEEAAEHPETETGTDAAGEETE